MIRHLSTEIETDILMETYKANTFFTTEKKHVVLLMSLCRMYSFERSELNERGSLL
jgi:hypothetical protein